VLSSANTVPDWLPSSRRVEAVISLSLLILILSSSHVSVATLAKLDIKRKYHKKTV
jgi:hypothetical protein